VIENFKGHPGVNKTMVLWFSLSVVIPEVDMFIDYCNSFSGCPSCQLMAENLRSSKNQQKLTFEEFMTLADTLTLNKH
jgi:hypothetical protein